MWATMDSTEFERRVWRSSWSTCRRDHNRRGCAFGEFGDEVHASVFGCNTYSYMRSHGAEACVARLRRPGIPGNSS